MTKQSILMLLIIYFGLINVVFSQCSEIYFYRPNSIMQNDETVYLTLDGKKVANIKLGDRYSSSICTTGSYKFIVKYNQKSTLFSSKTIDITKGKTYYIKISSPLGVPLPIIKIMEKFKAEKDLRKTQKFIGQSKKISINNQKSDKPELIAKKETPIQIEKDIISSTSLPPENNSNEVLELIPESIISKPNKTGTNLDYYFYLDKNIIDVRDLSIVNSNIYGNQIKILKNGSYVLGYNSDDTYNPFTILSTFDSNNKLVNNFKVEGYISPDWKYNITLKDGDLWRQDINFSTGTLTKPRQLTKLGLFHNQFTYRGWFNDNIVIQPKSSLKEIYNLNTLNGEIDKLSSGYDYRGGILSPNGRFMSIRTWKKSFRDISYTEYYDIETKTVLPNLTELINNSSTTKNNGRSIITGSHSRFWLDKTHVVNLHSKWDWDKINVITSLEIINIQKANDYKKIVLENFYGDDIKRYAFAELPNYLKSDSDYPFLGYYSQKKMCYIENNHFIYLINIQDNKDKKVQTYFYDLTTGQKKLWSDKDNFFDRKPNGDLKPNLAWLNTDEVIHSNNGDLIVQGTWITNAKNGKKIKLTPFIGTKYRAFRHTGYVLFIANKTLYRYNHNDGSLKIVKENIPQYSRIDTLIK